MPVKSPGIRTFPGTEAYETVAALSQP
jgi:hypothetical protein